jgi:hypothetical protein
VPEGEIAPAASSSTGLVFGISDEKADTWLDDARPETHARTARRIVPYNIMDVESEIEEFEAFYQANADNQMMVSFQFKCRTDGDCFGGNDVAQRRAHAPGRNEYVNAVRRFMNEFPKVRIVSAWNEPNHRGQPFGFDKHGPKSAAMRTHWLQRWVCGAKRKCAVVAGDIWQKRSSFVRWVRIYREHLRKLNGSRASTPMPRFWGTHPYYDVWSTDPPYGSGEAAREVRRSSTNKFITAAGPSSRIWLTEVGSRVGSGYEDETGQRRETEYLTNSLAVQRRVDRVYYYYLCNTAFLPGDDTGLTRLSSEEHACGDPRPAFGFYRDKVQAGRSPGKLPYDP